MNPHDAADAYLLRQRHERIARSAAALVAILALPIFWAWLTAPDCSNSVNRAERACWEARD